MLPHFKQAGTDEGSGCWQDGQFVGRANAEIDLELLIVVCTRLRAVASRGERRTNMIVKKERAELRHYPLFMHRLS